jgi:hypothetical protein
MKRIESVLRQPAVGLNPRVSRVDQIAIAGREPQERIAIGKASPSFAQSDDHGRREAGQALRSTDGRVVGLICCLGGLAVGFASIVLKNSRLQ